MVDCKISSNLKLCVNGDRFSFHSTSLFKQKPNTLNLAAQEMNGVASKPRSTHESVDGDPEEIHYATLTFNAPNPNPDIIAEDIQTDYAEICPCNSQGKEA